jgi:hypothetical protein
MGDFLTNLAARLDTAPDVVRPRLAALFEPVPDAFAIGPEPRLDIEMAAGLREDAETGAEEEPLAAAPHRSVSRGLRTPRRAPEPPSDTAGDALASDALRQGDSPTASPEGAARRARVRPSTAPPAEEPFRPSVAPTPKANNAHGVQPLRPQAPPSPETHVAAAVMPSTPLRAPAAPPAQPRSQPVPDLTIAPPSSAFMPLAPPPTPAFTLAPTAAMAAQARPATMPSRREPSAKPEPTIHVTIGRVEVRAVEQASPRRREPARPAVMSLDEYLAGRGKRGGA